MFLINSLSSDEDKIFDFRRATVFCLGHRFSKPKMIEYAKNVGGMPRWQRLCLSSCSCFR